MASIIQKHSGPATRKALRRRKSRFENFSGAAAPERKSWPEFILGGEEKCEDVILVFLRKLVDARFALVTSVVDVDDFGVGVKVDGGVAYFSGADAGIFCAAEGDMRFAANRW
jgi:hypothetical protein